jgi:peptidyl-tRNA hydrolase
VRSTRGRSTGTVGEARREPCVCIGQPGHRVQPTPASIAAVSDAPHDPLRMYLIVRRGAFEDLSRAGELAGAAAVRCVREFTGDPELEAWRPRPGKVVLRARGGQWRELLQSEERASVIEGAVAALPPRRRSARGPLLERMQAMTTELAAPPEAAEPAPGAMRLTYFVNPGIEMSSGKTLAQIAHAAVMAADGHDAWAEAGCPARVVLPTPTEFAQLCENADIKVEDAGLTEVAPGTVTVVALPPGVG